MSAHLSRGSTKPPLIEGSLRLYSMQFCPFAERVRLILLVKNIKHDIVNVNLHNKPEWLFQLNPKGLVPILETGNEVVVESLDICDYLNEKYPEPPLYPDDVEKFKADVKIINDFKALIKINSAIIREKKKSLEEYVNDAMPKLLELEGILKQRGTFFGGSVASMVDYMLWPWAERLKVIEITYEKKLPIAKSQLLHLHQWCASMAKLDAVVETITSPERLYKVSLFRNPGVIADFDSV